MQVLQQQSPVQKAFGLFVALIAWLSIAFQYYITDLSFINFISYFTTQCNLLIAISLTCSILVPSSRPGIFFSQLSVQSSIALYIFIVSIVYNTVLRGLWVLNGWSYFLDNMVHVINPVLYILYWLFFRTTGTLQWRNGVKWMLYPFIYLVYSLVRGALLNWYPYPFLNAIKLGYSKVAGNIAIMLIVFFIAGLILIAITKVVQSNHKAAKY